MSETNCPVSTIAGLEFFLLLLLQRGSQAGNPAIVTLEGTAKDQLLSHDRESR